ncbi:MAG TPA: DUF4386 domain-containing protein [Thermoanaerobaculia bacterium]|nr:DUF4386 domain-containing protein [Thermoanaerobaculia bacterium]
MSPVQRQARLAGFLYFLVVLSAPVGLIYVPSKLIVSGNATATADNIRASEWLLRLGIASELVHQVIFIFVVLALYRLFKAVDEGLARQMLVLGALVSVPIAFVNVLNEIATSILVSGAEFLSVFAKPQLDALAYLFLRLHGQGISVVSIFWGLWLLPFGMLVIRSGFIPRVFGVLLLIAGVAIVGSSFTTLVLPRYAALVSQIAAPLQLAELPIVFWLLIWGAKERSSALKGGSRNV